MLENVTPSNAKWKLVEADDSHKLADKGKNKLEKSPASSIILDLRLTTPQKKITGAESVISSSSTMPRLKPKRTGAEESKNEPVVYEFSTTMGEVAAETIRE